VTVQRESNSQAAQNNNSYNIYYPKQLFVKKK